MSHVIVALIALVAGGIIVFVLVSTRLNRALEALKAADEKVGRLATIEARLSAEKKAFGRDSIARLEQLRAAQLEFDSRVVTYDEMRRENATLKQDLRNFDISLNKLTLDRNVQAGTLDALDTKCQELGLRFLKDNVKWITNSLNANNFVACKQRLTSVINWCREIGLKVSADDEAALMTQLKKEFEAAVRAALEREEQARIKAKIREEQLLLREVERELKQIDRERSAIQAALAAALADAQDIHSAQVEELRARLADAETRAQRAVSQAQLTKAGNVYVISNVGSFGSDVFKIGMTRRLEPLDRVRELGDASVPFPFDVHMMIACQDAPALEYALHKKLHKKRINKVNPRREFFKTSLDAVLEIVREHHGEVQYTVDSEALQYRQSLDISEEDQEFVEAVFERWDEEEGTAPAIDPDLPE